MKKEKQKEYSNREPCVKWVKKARMFAKTSLKEGKQIIEWSKEEPIL